MLPGARVIVTSAGGGIGLTIARAFSDHGARVHINDVPRGNSAAR